MKKKESLVNQVRKAWGWSHADLAARMGYSVGTIKNASSTPSTLTGPMEAHLKTLLELAELRKKEEK